MKKVLRFFPLLMAIVMMSMSPMKMWADDVVEVRTYDELYDAIINKGEHNILVKDNITFTGTLSIPSRRVEIDFNSHYITFTGTETTNIPFFDINTSANVVIKNLSVYTPSYMFAKLSNSTLTLTHCILRDFNYRAVYDQYAKSTLNIDGGSSISNTSSYGLLYGVKVNLNGPCKLKNIIKGIFVDCDNVKIAGEHKVVDKDGNAVDLTQSNTEWGKYIDGANTCGDIQVLADESSCGQGAHDIALTTTIQPTCTTAGRGDYQCSKCHKDFADTEGKWLATSTVETTPALGHDFVEDPGNLKVTCSHTGCTFEAPMLTEGTHTGLTYAANSTADKQLPSGYTTLYYFKAPGTGTLTVQDSGGKGSTYGALFNADMSSCLTYTNATVLRFKLTYEVTEGQVYWIGACHQDAGDEATDHTIEITGTWTPTIIDGWAYDGSYDNKQASTLIYKRKFYDNDWNCLYVPFKADVTAFTDCQIYTINMFQQHDTNGDGVLDELTLEVNKAVSGKILPNHPYLIKYTGELTDAEKASGKDVSIEMSNISIAEAETADYTCSSMSTDYTFKGTYSAIDAATATSGNYYALITDDAGKTVLGKTTTGLKPQRWYMTMQARDAQLETSSAVNAPKHIRIAVVGEDVTSIDNAQLTVNNEQLTVNNGKRIENGRIVILKNGKKYNVNGQTIK